MQPETWTLSIGGASVPIAIHSRLQIDAAEAVVEAALAGTGIIRLFSYHVASAVKDGKSALLLEAFEPAPLPVNIVYMGGGLLPLKVRAFLDFAAPRLKVRLAAEPLLSISTARNPGDQRQASIGVTNANRPFRPTCR